MKPTAILFQAQKPPVKDRVVKPMKPGGYSDSGADIAYALKASHVPVITPVDVPDPESDIDWVFADTDEGIQLAIAAGAKILWLNTVLYKGHPVEKYIQEGIHIVGQIPEMVDLYDDKWITNQLLRENGLTIPKSILIDRDNAVGYQMDFPFPVVIKPIRGRGSQGVRLVEGPEKLAEIVNAIFEAETYGAALYVEQYLSGEEVTITIMQPGSYTFPDGIRKFDNFWCLPPVKRFNHQNGIAPYNGTVAVINNSVVLDSTEINMHRIQNLCRQCELAARLVHAKAPIRIDCRADQTGNYYLFDLNMKPNMTGASRPGRIDQDSLSAMAAREIGWSFPDLLVNMLAQAWAIIH